MYKIVAPMVIPIIKIKVPSHLPKINPANKETGIPKPAITTHMIEESKKIKDTKNNCGVSPINVAQKKLLALTLKIQGNIFDSAKGIPPTNL